ncbi:MAG: alanine racemase [bacterium]
MKIFRPIWAEIDCDKVEHNFNLIRERVGAGVKIMGVVKADAYGHGAVAVSKSLLHAGVDSLAVASLEEGDELRRAGIGAEIMILGYTQPNWASAVVEGGYTQTVYHLNLARALSAEAVRLKKTVPVHVKIDSGMGRIGIEPEHALPFMQEISRLEGIELKGIFTHFSMADEPGNEYTGRQLERFGQLLNSLKAAGCYVPVIHASNSAAVLMHPEANFNLVRPGILLYGLSPAPTVKDKAADFRPVMTVKTTIVELKTVSAGSRISYGGTFTASRAARIATFPAGYADGFSRLLSNRGSVLIGGRNAPIAGSVCMDFTMADVTDVPDVKVGDEVVLIGRQGNETIEVDDIAAMIGTINYEVVSLIGKRVQRVFTNYVAGNPNEI